MALQVGETQQALQRALGTIRDEGALATVFKGLARLAYREAASDCLTVFRRMKNEECKLDAAWALARLRYAPAAPPIRKFVREIRRRGLEDDRAEKALHAFYGNWGKPGGGLRILISAPTQARIGKSTNLILLIENVSSEPVEFLLGQGHQVWINGKRPGRNMLLRGSFINLAPGEVRGTTLDISWCLKSPGARRLRYVVGEARSNEVAIVAQGRTP